MWKFIQSPHFSKGNWSRIIETGQINEIETDFPDLPQASSMQPNCFSTKQNDVKRNYEADTGCSGIVVMDTAQAAKILS